MHLTMSGHLNLPRVGKWISLTRTIKTEGCWADVYVQRNATSTQATGDCTPSNVTFDVGTVIYSLGAEEAPILPEGPYFLDINAKKLLKAYRLYDDTQQAFLQVSHCNYTDNSCSECRRLNLAN